MINNINNLHDWQCYWQLYCVCMGALRKKVVFDTFTEWWTSLGLVKVCRVRMMFITRWTYQTPNVHVFLNNPYESALTIICQYSRAGCIHCNIIRTEMSVISYQQCWFLGDNIYKYGMYTCPNAWIKNFMWHPIIFLCMYIYDSCVDLTYVTMRWWHSYTQTCCMYVEFDKTFSKTTTSFVVCLRTTYRCFFHDHKQCKLYYSLKQIYIYNRTYYRSNVIFTSIRKLYRKTITQNSRFKISIKLFKYDHCMSQ